ncbi:hypothetical protein [Herbiconiux sp. A18JL235]|uniref:DUF222 domain-containing protein n=1 Tax=Herbiconiux sp. A18JL235 TaxID=3152363 RepID=A0AB39BCM2_9MICO
MAPQEAQRLTAITADLESVLAVPTATLDDASLLAEVTALERLARVVGAAQIRVAGEIAARSRPELGDEGLSHSENFSTPVRMLAALTQASSREARSRLGFHHGHLHRSSWRLEMRGGAPHIVPSAWVDRAQTPIPVSRRRTASPLDVKRTA